MNRLAMFACISVIGSLAGAASAELVVNLGTVQQLSPRPTINYSGGFGSFVSSHVDVSGTRTITAFDLYGIAQQLGGGLTLTEIRVRDTSTNTYGSWSPGADIDLVKVLGADLSAGTVRVGYQGTVTQHAGEIEDVLKTRLANCDAASGDQHFNSQHFISLGLGGMAWMNFSGYPNGSTGAVAGGPGSTDGSGGTDPSNGTTLPTGGLMINQGMKIEIGEAGTGETYGVDLVFDQVAVPAPGALSLLGLAGLMGRRRR